MGAVGGGIKGSRGRGGPRMVITPGGEAMGSSCPLCPQRWRSISTSGPPSAPASASRHGTGKGPQAAAHVGRAASAGRAGDEGFCIISAFQHEESRAEALGPGQGAGEQLAGQQQRHQATKQMLAMVAAQTGCQGRFHAQVGASMKYGRGPRIARNATPNSAAWRPPRGQDGLALLQHGRL